MNLASTVREQLLGLAEPGYRQFTSALIPNIDSNTVLGVRMPALRQMAKELARGDWRAYLADAEGVYFEEVMVQGLVLGYVKAEIEEHLRYIAAFVPKIDNWSVCDSFCVGLKMTKKHKERVWDFLQPFLASDQAYAIRFGVVMLLNYYVDEGYVDRVLKQLDRIQHEDYYVKMAVAWAIATCYTTLPAPTMRYLERNTLDDFTYNKALQKITESLRVDPGTKAMIRAMKRK